MCLYVPLGRLRESNADRSMSDVHMHVFLIASHRSGKNSPAWSRAVQNGKNRPCPKTLLLGCSSIYRGLWPLVNQCTPESPAAMISRVVLGRQACLWTSSSPSPQWWWQWPGWWRWCCPTRCRHRASTTTEMGGQEKWGMLQQSLVSSVEIILKDGF